MSAVTATPFDDIWVPRIGTNATRVLRRHGYLTMLCPLVMMTCAGICSFAYTNGSKSGLVIGVILTFVGAAALTVWIRSFMELADALSTHFGARIRWTETPSLRLNRFDDWCAKKAFSRASSAEPLRASEQRTN
jgi:hypothetical protein